MNEPVYMNTNDSQEIHLFNQEGFPSLRLTLKAKSPWVFEVEDFQAIDEAWRQAYSIVPVLVMLRFRCPNLEPKVEAFEL